VTAAPGTGPLAAIWTVLVRGWALEPLVTLSLTLTAILYWEGVRGVRQHNPRAGWPRSRSIYFAAGLAVLFVALESPVDGYADRLFSDHMVQHTLLMMIAAPLLLLGRPVTLALAGSSGRARKRIAAVAHSRTARILGSPLVGFGALVVVLWSFHFSWLYNAALTNTALHATEHLAMLSAALLFWWPVVAKDPGSARLSHPARLLYLFLAMPVTSLLAYVITSSDHVLYVHYDVTTRALGMSALADQQLGGTIMWVASMLVGTIALSAVLLDWMDRDENDALRADALRARSERGLVAEPGRGSLEGEGP
jgi:putative membrane protein